MQIWHQDRKHCTTHNKVTDAYATELTEIGMCDLHEEAYDYSIKTIISDLWSRRSYLSAGLTEGKWLYPTNLLATMTMFIWDHLKFGLELGYVFHFWSP
jgi:hypothetical protein